LQVFIEAYAGFIWALIWTWKISRRTLEVMVNFIQTQEEKSVKN